MNRKLFFRLLLSAAFLISFFCVAPILQSCSEGPEPFSDFSLHPDVPLESYAAGRLGIVRPTFARSYLVVAYRYFSDVPLTKDEQFGAQALWSERIGNENVVEPYLDQDRPKNPYIEANSRRSREDWEEARKLFGADASVRIDEMKDGSDYFRYLNCANDALETATATLKARASAFGKDHAGVKDWLKAQDAVFQNCGNPKEPAIPEAASPSLPEIFRFDREYQIAAAHLYANQFDEAEKAFEKISSEEKSPWRNIAPYLVARNKLRRAFLDIPKPEAAKYGLVTIPPFQPELMQAAADYTRKLLTDKPNRPFASSLEALVDRAEFRLHPAVQTVSLSDHLRSAAPDGKFHNWLCDYAWLLDKRPDSRPGDFYDPRDTDAKAYVEAAPERQKDELTDWLISFQANDDSATNHALQEWRAHATSLPWLLAVLAKMNSTAPYSAEVLAAADKIPTTSPAYLTAFYHRMRLRNAAKQFGDVRKSIDAFFKVSADVPNVSRNELLDLRLDAASDLDDSIRFIARDNCLPEQRAANVACPQLLAPHSTEVMESLPLDTILKAYENPALSQELKNQISRNIWMRAILLNRHDVAQKLDPQVLPGIGASPQGIKPEYVADLLKQYETATTVEEKQFAAVFFLQHQYAFGYEMSSTEPWCASPSGPWHEDNSYTRAKPFVPASPAFMTAEQTKQAAAERAILDAADSQANYYTRVAIEFALKHPDDPRVPESLSRAVKNTRMNCNNDRTSLLSRKAFDLLHSKYPNTSWAKNTKYWY